MKYVRSLSLSLSRTRILSLFTPPLSSLSLFARCPPCFCIRRIYAELLAACLIQCSRGSYRDHRFDHVARLRFCCALTLSLPSYHPCSRSFCMSRRARVQILEYFAGCNVRTNMFVRAMQRINNCYPIYTTVRFPIASTAPPLINVD